MVFGLFSKERSLQKTIEKATNKLAQQADRWSALEKLREESTDDALFGLCKRFCDHAHEGCRGRAREALGRRCPGREGQRVARPAAAVHEDRGATVFPVARARARRRSRSSTLKAVDEIFASEPPGYVRMPERRIDLIKWFSEWKGATDDEFIPRITPYLPDFDENVRFVAIDGLSTRDPARIAAPLIDALIRPEEESGRIRRTVLEVLEKTKAPLGRPQQ